MNTAALQHAQQDGTAFASRFYHHHTFAWPDIAASPAAAGARRTTGKWDTGSYTPQVQQHMRAAFADAMTAEDGRLAATWTDPTIHRAWRDAASAEYGRLLNDVARFPEPTASAGPA